MSKILVTRGAGFIGTNFVEELSECGHRVTVFDNFSTGKIENLLSLLEKYPDSLTLQKGDIHDLADCQKATEGTEHVFHLVQYLKEYFSEHGSAIAQVEAIHGSNRAGDIPTARRALIKPKYSLKNCFRIVINNQIL